jgi:hypothetical protein
MKPQQNNDGRGVPALTAEKRVILSMGGKGGVGKTSLMTALTEWFDAKEIPAQLLDLDSENKARGSLAHFFGARAPKVNIHTPAGLDAFVDQLVDGAPVILADMGSGSGQVTYDWFDRMYPDVTEAGIAFTAIGVITSDPASVESTTSTAVRRLRRSARLKNWRVRFRGRQVRRSMQPHSFPRKPGSRRCDQRRGRRRENRYSQGTSARSGRRWP